MEQARKSDLNRLAISTSRIKLTHFEIRAFISEDSKRGGIGQNI